MFLFKKKSNNYLGIDISASAVKIVELEKDDNRHNLKNYAIFSLEKYLKDKGKEIDPEAFKMSNEEVADIVKRTIKEAKIKSKDVYLSVPVYSSFYTLIDFPNMSEKEIAAAIPFEARKYVPVPISEVVLDWSIVSPPSIQNPNIQNSGQINSKTVQQKNQANQQKSQQVLLIAVPKKIINDYSQIIKLAGLNLKGIEGETFSLARALIGNDKSVIILIDNGARSINISIIDDGYIRVTHNLEMGGRKISKAIAQQMNFSFEKAEQVKRGLSNGQSANQLNSQLKGVIQSSLGVIVIEIKKIIDSYQNKYNRRIEKCILVGSGARLVGFTDHLVEKLSLDTAMGNPFARMAYPQILKPILKDLGFSLAVAVGLAMREE